MDGHVEMIIITDDLEPRVLLWFAARVVAYHESSGGFLPGWVTQRTVNLRWSSRLRHNEIRLAKKGIERAEICSIAWSKAGHRKEYNR
jgi:hypothetical protein